MTAYTARSVIFDIANNWGSTSYLAVRSIEFFYKGKRAWPTYVAYSDGNLSTYYPTHAFNITQSKVGGWSGVQWFAPSAAVTNRRLIVVFDREMVFDEVVINNSHNAGGTTNSGIKDVVITASTDSITDVTYGASISNSTTVFTGTVAQHTASNVVDDQYLLSAPFPAMSPQGGNYDAATQTISITSADADAIYYTTDGSDPTTASSAYSSPLSFTDGMVIKALAVKSGLADSAIVEHAYINNRSVATPTMTSNTTPSGVASASSQWDATYQPFEAFDGVVAGDSANAWISGNNTFVNLVGDEDLEFQFDSAVTITCFRFSRRDNTTAPYPRDYSLLGSNDGTNWDTLYTSDYCQTIGSGEYGRLNIIPSPASYARYRLNTTSIYPVGTSVMVVIGELELFAGDISTGPEGGFNLRIGSDQIAEVYLGSTQIHEIYLGSTKL